MRELTDFTARYTVTEQGGRYRFRYFCAYCDDGYATDWIRADTMEEAKNAADKEARLYFNACFTCDKWVCDKHYQANTQLCSECGRVRERNTRGSPLA